MGKHSDGEKNAADLHQAHRTVVRMIANPTLTDKQYEKLVAQLEELEDEIRDDN